MQIDVRTNIDAVLGRMQRHADDVVGKAIPLALNRVGDQAATQVGRELAAQGYGFKAREARDAVSVFKASRTRLAVTLRVRRRTKSLILFGARETKQGVIVKVRGQARLVRHAFIAQLRNGERGVYIEDKAAGKVVLRRAKQYKRGSRGGWHEYPVRKLYGPSVGGAFSTERVQVVMRRFYADRFEQRLAYEISRLSR